MPNQTRDYGDLWVTLTKDFTFGWDNRHFGSTRGCTFWHPNPQGNLYPMGSICLSDRNNQGETNFRAALLVGPNPNSPGGSSAVARPVDWTRIWGYGGGHGSVEAILWRPVAPPGYVSMGDVMVYRLNKPSNDSLVWCLRADLVGSGTYRGERLWTGSGADYGQGLSIWGILPSSNGVEGSENVPVFADTFRGILTPNYTPTKPNNGLSVVPQLRIPNAFREFTQGVPKVTPSTIPNTGKRYDVVENASVILPLTCFYPVDDSRCIDGVSNPFIEISKATSWFAEGVWENDGTGTFSREKKIKYGISRTQTEELTHSAGIEISASHGFKLVEVNVTLNYQFTSASSSSLTDFSETEVTERFEVPSKHVTVLFTKHLFLKGKRMDGSTVISQAEVIANDDLHFGGCPLP
ncbi:hypothetical protein BOTCAL_0457g00070 [Botryotinia calthae]|uniref:Insecticidal crystal toxin domain-containing protein n=1 Tax=Botryotinia calthae TaxID=38488 RepID=A0A4Y8CQM3_9HELO|nr:hypothetical protein BOTCAL_0457g00070 [Botryotinia calthae]